MASDIARTDILSAVIIEKAVEDWRLLVKTGKTHANLNGEKVSFRELREFFNSPWCALLMHGMAVTPEQVLHRLEQELAGEAQPPVEKYITTPSRQIVEKIARMREEGKTWHAISRTLNVHWTTARKWYMEAEHDDTTGEGHREGPGGDD